MKKYMFLIIAMAVLFGSCQKEEMTINEFDDILDSLVLKSDGDENDEDDDGKCYEILFPLSLNMPDGPVITGDTKKELHEAVKSWFKNNRKAKRKDISFHFPLDVNFKGKILALEDESQLERIRMACKKDRDDEGRGDKDKDKVPCIEMLYPVSYLLPSTRTFTANNGKELREFMVKWKENNPDSRKRPAMVYPVNIKFKGRELTINTEREMMRVKNACAGEGKDKDKDKDNDKKDCFELVYPLSYKMPDGMLITRDSEEEMNNAIKRWYNANRSDKKPLLQFPIEINYGTDDEPRIVNIEDAKALKKAWKDCDD